MNPIKTSVSITIVVLLAILNFCCKQNTAQQTTGISIQPGKIKVAVLLYPGAELLDFAGPTEVFSNSKYFQVYTVAAVPEKLSTKHNALNITSDFTISNAPQPDILVIPGGPLNDINLATANDSLITWIKKVNAKTQFTMSVCTGADILSKAGLLDGKTVTTHSGAIDTLQQLTPKAKFISNVRFVEDGKIITTAGVSAGIDGSLHVVEKLKGLKEALLITAIMEYDKWKREDGLVTGGNAGIKIADHEPVNVYGESNMMSVSTGGDAHDIVCGMTASKANSKYHVIYQGKEYHFCSASCKKLFENNSALYASKK